MIVEALKTVVRLLIFAVILTSGPLVHHITYILLWGKIIDKGTVYIKVRHLIEDVLLNSSTNMWAENKVY